MEDTNQPISTDDVAQTSTDPQIVDSEVQLREAVLRARADYANLQKQTAEQKSEWMSWCKAQVLESFIPVYENFKKAFSHDVEAKPDAMELQKQWENWKKGIEYIMKQYGDLLLQHGLEPMNTVGQMFSAERHDAVGEEESDQENGVILREVEGGYMMAGKVLKVAKVIISKKQ